MSKAEKSPYRDYSIADVHAAETGNYYIQIGAEIFQSENGKMAFNKKRVEEMFDTLRSGLEDMKRSKNQQEVEDAYSCLCNLKIYPLRIH